MNIAHLTSWDLQDMIQKGELINLSYSDAVQIADKGLLATRKVWENKFIFKRPADTLTLNILLGAKSLPKGLKDYYERKYQPITTENMPAVYFSEYLCLKNENDSIVNAFSPSYQDLIAQDWMIFVP